MNQNLAPGTVTTLGALRPGDVGAFIPESEWFVVYETWPSGKVVVLHDDDHGAAPCLPTRKVRYLGRGRIEPARIVMDGEPDRAAELEEQVRTLREALNMYRSAFGQALEAHGIPLGPQQRLADEISEAALAATAPKEKP